MGYLFFVGAFLGYVALDLASNAILRRNAALTIGESSSLAIDRTAVLNGLTKWGITDVPMSILAGLALPVRGVFVITMLVLLLACREVEARNPRPVFAPFRTLTVVLTGICSLLAYFLPLMLVAYKINHHKL